MPKRANAVTFKGNPLTLVGPQLKPGDKAPDFKCVTGALSLVGIADTPAKARLFSVRHLGRPVPPVRHPFG